MELKVDPVQLDIVYRALELYQDRIPAPDPELKPSIQDLFDQIEKLKQQYDSKQD